MTDQTPNAARRWHDMGGDYDPLNAPTIDPTEHDYALWEKRVDALMVLTSEKGLLTVDGLRRALEDMGPQAFETMSYYERWIASITQNLIEGGAITVEDLRAKMADVAARGETYGDASLDRSAGEGKP
ncbi:MAG: ScnB-like protein [Pseudomonadota bacterium]